MNSLRLCIFAICIKRCIIRPYYSWLFNLAERNFRDQHSRIGDYSTLIIPPLYSLSNSNTC